MIVVRQRWMGDWKVAAAIGKVTQAEADAEIELIDEDLRELAARVEWPAWGEAIPQATASGQTAENEQATGVAERRA